MGGPWLALILKVTLWVDLLYLMPRFELDERESMHKVAHRLGIKSGSPKMNLLATEQSHSLFH